EVPAGDEAVGDLVVRGGEVGEPVGEAPLVRGAEGGAGGAAQVAGGYVRFLGGARARERRVTRLGGVGSVARAATRCLMGAGAAGLAVGRGRVGGVVVYQLLDAHQLGVPGDAGPGRVLAAGCRGRAGHVWSSGSGWSN